MEKLLRPKEVAELLGVSVNQLNVWRCQARNQADQETGGRFVPCLPYRKIGRAVRYPENGVRAFIESLPQKKQPITQSHTGGGK